MGRGRSPVAHLTLPGQNLMMIHLAVLVGCDIPGSCWSVCIGCFVSHSIWSSIVVVGVGPYRRPWKSLGGLHRSVPLHRCSYIQELGGDAFTRKTILFDLGVKVIKKCCPVPFTSCDLSTCKVWSCYVQCLGGDAFTTKIHYLTLNWLG